MNPFLERKRGAYKIICKYKTLDKQASSICLMCEAKQSKASQEGAEKGRQASCHIFG